MANPVSRLKKRLSTVREDSVHFSITSFVWKKYLVPGQIHSCKYYWVLLPTSLILAAILLIVAVVVVAFGIFFGNIPTFIGNGADDEDDQTRDTFYGHRRRPNGQPWPRFIPAPYQVVAPVVFVISAYVLITDYTKFTIYGVIGLVVLAALGGVILLISKNWNQPLLKSPREIAVRSIDSGLNKVCPMLIIVPKASDPEPDLIEQSESTA